MKGLTKPQEQCLDIIVQFIMKNGHAPTRQELTDRLKEKSVNGVNQKLTQLQHKGYIQIRPVRKKRNIIVLRKPEKQMVLFDELNNIK